MDKQLLLTVCLLFATDTQGRGPHHPRGEGISKHHVHYRPTKQIHDPPDKLTQDMELLHDKEHIQEDLGEWAQEKDIAAMTDEELEFHYFQLHDFDNNSRLDGLEILQAIHHTTHHDEQEEEEGSEHSEDFDYFIELIDRVLAEDDTNFDGYLSYPEYVAGRRKDIQAKVAQNGVQIAKASS